MARDYSNQNLQKASFINEDLSYANFSGSDLRGADFSDSDLTGADLNNVKTGITNLNLVWLFLVSMAISLASGYVAMLAGSTVQVMLASDDAKIEFAGYLTLALTLVFIVYTWWKGSRNAIMNLIVPAMLIAVALGIVGYVSGIGTGKGMLYLVLALICIVIMFAIGTIARTAAGALSNILFLVVALSGGMFGKSVGGGIGTMIMAIGCAMISKRALSGIKGFEGLQKISSFITRRYGTSFRNARLIDADFSGSKIRNADFTNAETSITLDKIKKVNCI